MTDTALIERLSQELDGVIFYDGGCSYPVRLMQSNIYHLELLKKCLTALEQSEWERVLIERLVVLHILSPEHETNPSKALHDIISYEVLISLDPLVSSDAVALIEKYGGTYPPAEVET